jgi:hypothetical protein
VEIYFGTCDENIIVKARTSNVFSFITTVSHSGAVLPLGGLGGRLVRQISGGGKFFEKKLKIGVFFWHFKKTKLIVAPLN